MVLQLLQACLRQVVPEGEETDLGGDGPGSEGDGTNGEHCHQGLCLEDPVSVHFFPLDMLLKQKQIEKIHAMLDTSKVCSVCMHVCCVSKYCVLTLI